MLPALTGAWKHRGGGASLSTSGAFAWNKQPSNAPISHSHRPLGRQARARQYVRTRPGPHRTRQQTSDQIN